MGIYSFSELSDEQKRKIYQFVSGFSYKGSYDSYEEMAKLYSGIAFDHGRSHFSLWDGERPAATIGVISKDAERRGEIFLVSFSVREPDCHRLPELFSKVYDYCSGINNARFRLGVMHDRYYLIPEIEKNGFTEVYRNLVMEYKRSDISLEEADDKCFKSMCPENIKDYQKVESAAFLQAPNGGVVEDEELQDLLDEYHGSNLAGVFYSDGQPAGTYTLRIKEDGGWIESIGVAPEFQGRGIGRKLLHKSVKVLLDAGVPSVKLSVFNSNTRAFELYKKDGFEVESEHSIWYER